MKANIGQFIIKELRKEGFSSEKIEQGFGLNRVLFGRVESGTRQLKLIEFSRFLFLISNEIKKDKTALNPIELIADIIEEFEKNHYKEVNLFS